MRTMTSALLLGSVLVVGCSASWCGEDAEMKARLEKYPIPLAAVDSGKVLAQIADAPQELFLDLGWQAAEVKVPERDEKAMSSVVAIQKDGNVVHVRMSAGANAVLQTQKTKEESFGLFVSSARPSTWSGDVKDKLDLPGAAFAAYYEPSKGAPNKVFACWANAEVVLVARKGQDGKFASDDELARIGKRFSELLGTPEAAKAEVSDDPKEGGVLKKEGVVLKIEKQTGKAAVVSWVVGDKLKGYWVRLDTSAGTLSLDVGAPGKVMITDLPPEGAEVTAYAISPSGRKWHRSKVKVALLVGADG